MQRLLSTTDTPTFEYPFDLIMMLKAQTLRLNAAILAVDLTRCTVLNHTVTKA